MSNNTYIIRGGVEGRERLRILSRVMQPSTHALLDRAGIRPGMACLEIGCGGGDLAFDLSRMVGPEGRVVATDIDETKLELACTEAEAQQLTNVEFRRSDITKDQPEQEFDLVHARFILTHLSDPAAALARMRSALRPGGIAVVEDIDFDGHFCHPESRAFRQYVDLYVRTARSRGGDARIGRRLPTLLTDAAFENVLMNIVQPAGMTGELKLLPAITMENIGDAVTAEGLATQDEIERIVDELHELARDPATVIGLPRIVETWGSQPH